MSHGAEPALIGLNWGSSALRAYLLSADGRILAERERADGIARVGRDGVPRALRAVLADWPNLPAYASGMIGSNVGWAEVPYVTAPANVRDIARAALPVAIDDRRLSILPGVACQRPDGEPDVMRGEETEIAGALCLVETASTVLLPGTHTKWARIAKGGIDAFCTSMSGEIYDRLTREGLLFSVVEGEAANGSSFVFGVDQGHRSPLGLGTLLFGVRARVLRGVLACTDAASYLRGLLIGRDLADALRLFPPQPGEQITIVGNGPLCALHEAALAHLGLAGRIIPSRDACAAGFAAVHARLANVEPNPVDP